MLAKTLMVQGTSSDAGKSILVTGICRVLARRGYRVAPFKPQNMALNSAVTIDGGEIGRAQAVQAQACNINPHTDMNPVLLKPSSDTGAQVIIQGHALNNMEASHFHDYKKIAMKAVLDSYERLQSAYDFVIVEGAGSPAEINLRDNDIANMGFAETVDCPVILIADIDRGGVFAHLLGTLDLLSETERRRVTGFVINRFRGDLSLLQSGLDWLERRTLKKVWGVLPYLQQFYLDAEDAITARVSETPKRIRIAVPVFAHISNHTDFDALQLHPDIDMIFVAPGDVIPPVDIIILPGSKHVRHDLERLKNYDWDQQIYRHLRYGGKLIGICGGYQMLGRGIDDPDGIEGEPGFSHGLNLLNIDTVLEAGKTLKQVSGQLKLLEADVMAKGYEIHCGISSGVEHYQPLFILENNKKEGVVSEDGAILGTYLHGLFDEPAVSNTVLSWAGFDSSNSVNLQQVRETQLERLADCLEEHLDEAFFIDLMASK